MAILQHYYTSWYSGSTSGFQTKGKSKDVSIRFENILRDLAIYKLPDLRYIEYTQPPLALRYTYSSESCYLLNINSVKYDPVNRKGNIFVHTLQMNPDDLLYPPIYYWQSKSWISQDPQPQNTQEIDLPSFADMNDFEPGVQQLQILDFLHDHQHPQRDNIYKKLLSAVIHSESSFRQVFIVAQPHEVAMWIASISMVLPIKVAKLISFSTYHHQADNKYIINGVLPKTQISSNNHTVLEQEVVYGHIDDSAYAEWATKVIYSSNTEDVKYLFDHIQLCQRLLPPPTTLKNLDQYLKMYVDYFAFIKNGIISNSTEKVIEALLQQHDLLNGDIDIISTIHGNYLEHLLRTPKFSDNTLQIYSNTLQILYNKYTFSEKSTLLKNDLRSILNSSENDTIFRALLKISILVSNDDLQRIFNDSDILRQINNLSKTNALQHQTIQKIWEYLPENLLPDMIDLFFISSFHIPKLSFDDKNSLKKQMIRVISNNKEQWLKYLIDHNIKGDEILSIYLELTDEFSLSDREKYRKIIGDHIQGIIDIEFYNDISISISQYNEYQITHHKGNIGFKVILQSFQKWADYLNPPQFNTLFLKFYTKLKQDLKEIWEVFTQNLLLDRENFSAIQRIDKTCKEDILRDALSSISDRMINEEQQRIISSYHDEIPNDLHEILSFYALRNGSISYEQAKIIIQKVQQWDPREYQKFLDQTLEYIFSSPISDHHGFQVLACYRKEYIHLFWENYFKKIKTHLSKDDTNIASIINYWFENAPPELSKRPYITQTFFVFLPQILNVSQRKLEIFKQYPWYDLLIFLKRM